MAHLVGGAGAIKSAMLANQGCIDSVASDKVVCTNLVRGPHPLCRWLLLRSIIGTLMARRRIY